MFSSLLLARVRHAKTFQAAQIIWFLDGLGSQAAVCPCLIGERLLEGNVICIHAVTKHVIREPAELASRKDTGYGTKSDVDNIVGNAPSVRITAEITRKGSQTASRTGRSGRHTGV